jgi:hypothetical protein
MVAMRTALVSSAAVLAFAAGMIEPADAAFRRGRATEAAKKPSPERDAWNEAAKGVQQIVVSIGNQRVTLYSNGKRVAQGPVSTGTPGHPTPMGVFSIIQKDRYHHSNLYGNAPMYYMQRITWSGSAMHEGALPGYAASHGCIRLSHGFAASLWPITKLGVRVIVARNDIAPTDFDHPKLFVPKPKPVVGPEVMNEPQRSGLMQVAQSTTPATDARGLEVAEPGAEAAKPAATQVDPPKPAPPVGKVATPPVKQVGHVSVFVSRKEHKIFVRQGFVPLFDMPVEFDQPERPLGTHVFTALGQKADGSGMHWNLMSIPTTMRKVAASLRHGKKGRETKPAVVETVASSSAAEALDRIHIPDEAFDRIGELLAPGTSLVVSDLGISGETGRGTDFIVLAR